MSVFYYYYYYLFLKTKNHNPLLKVYSSIKLPSLSFNSWKQGSKLLALTLTVYIFIYYNIFLYIYEYVNFTYGYMARAYVNPRYNEYDPMNVFSAVFKQKFFSFKN